MYRKRSDPNCNGNNRDKVALRTTCIIICIVLCNVFTPTRKACDFKHASQQQGICNT